MATRSGPAAGDLSIGEIKEFAAFPASTQRYIRRSLDIGLERDDAIARWLEAGNTGGIPTGAALSCQFAGRVSAILSTLSG